MKWTIGIYKHAVNESTVSAFTVHFSFTHIFDFNCTCFPPHIGENTELSPVESIDFLVTYVLYYIL